MELVVSCPLKDAVLPRCIWCCGSVVADGGWRMADGAQQALRGSCDEDAVVR